MTTLGGKRENISFGWVVISIRFTLNSLLYRALIIILLQLFIISKTVEKMTLPGFEPATIVLNKADLRLHHCATELICVTLSL